MADVVSNTSPLQYLHQIHLLDLLVRLCGRIGRIASPPAVWYTEFENPTRDEEAAELGSGLESWARS